MKKKKAILSYDYELFFGDRSGTVQKSLIDPTNSLLDAMDAVGLKGNFFVDWQMLKYLKEANTERTTNDLILIENQLKDIIRRGHRIELHIHPHWVDAKYNGDGTWNFDEFRHYSLQSFKESEVTSMFKEGTVLLESIARKIVPDYKIIAFRAGGWAVQPFTKLKKGFEEAGIKIDSSPAKGFHVENIHSFYDFRYIPDKCTYSFKEDACVECEDGPFVCVPITTYQRSFFFRLLDKVRRMISDDFVCLTDGTHQRREDSKLNKEQKNYNDKQRVRMLSFNMSIWTLPFVLYSLRDREMLCFIQHPKDQNGVTTRVVKALSKYIETISYKDLSLF